MATIHKISVLLLAIVALYACKKDEPIDTISVNGALSGEFSVSLTDKVHFSQGNLQFNKNANTWRFATNQWEVYGGFKDGVTDLHGFLPTSPQSDVQRQMGL